jgi:hypothetical protein
VAGLVRASATDPLDQAGPKAALRPVYDALAAAITGFAYEQNA